MNPWVIVAVLLLGGALALAPTVWSWLDPTSPARAAERLLMVLNSWNAIRDCTARVTVRGTEGELQAKILFLAPSSLRLEVLAPQSLTGTVFALRPIADGWLFVHYRPSVELGIEARISPQDLGKYVSVPTPSQLVEGLRRGRIRVTYSPGPTSDEFDLSGLPGGIPRLTLRVDPTTFLPQGVALYADPTQPPTVTIELTPKEREKEREPPGWELFEVNTGLGLKDLFLLDPVPRRWLASPPAKTQD